MPTLHWIGKDKVINHHLDVPFKVLEHAYGLERAFPYQQHQTTPTPLLHFLQAKPIHHYKHQPKKTGDKCTEHGNNIAAADYKQLKLTKYASRQLPNFKHAYQPMIKTLQQKQAERFAITPAIL